MANAIPVNSKTKKVESKTEFVKHEGEASRFKDAAAFEEHVKDILESEKPSNISDEQVNSLGQEKQYGKAVRADEVVYNVLDRKGEVVGERTCVRITH